MKKLTVLFLLFAAGTLLAQTPAARLPNEQWVSLFNGKDLTGWVEVGQEKWQVENGAIHGQGITKEYGYLRTDKKFKDFEMYLQFKADADGNSGVFFHSDFKPGTATVTQGLQFEIDRHLGNHTGGLYGDGREWIVWPAPELEGLIRQTDWNEFLLIVQGNRYICYLNGVKMVDFTDPKPKSFDGYISLQLHSGGEGNMWFKDLRIRDTSGR
ncbi:MAG: DUF1080 domain-containing protein [Acidobacteria bacterium]|nr:MAG: DUF1080 domain-containing protein [Acidobacteriota bacterium]